MAGYDRVENVLANLDSMLESADYICQSLENGNNEKNIISYFKKRLMCTLTETDYTVRLLLVVFKRFSDDAIDENIVNWIELVLKQEISDAYANFKFLNAAVEICGNSHDRHRSAVSSLIPALLQKCFTLRKSGNEVNSLALLKTCFTHFPSACGPNKSKAEKFILRYLDTPSAKTDIGNMAAKCFVLIQQSGPSGNCSIIHQENWTKAFNMLCETLMNVNDHVLSTGYTVVSAQNTYILEPLPEDCNVYNSLTIAGNRLHWLSRFLTEMFRSSYRTAKLFRPQTMIALLENALHNNNEPIAKTSVKLRSIRMDYQKDIFDLFCYFILAMRGNLVPFSDAIMRSLIAKLNEARHPYYNLSSYYKCSLYRLLATAIPIVGNNFDVTYQERLVNIIVEDITPTNETVRLSMPSSIKNARKRQKLANDQTIANSDAKSKSNSHCNSVVVKEKICTAALKCLVECMSHVSLSLKPAIEKKLYGIILTVTKSIEDGTMLLPYTNKNTHKLIYEILAKSLDQIHQPSLSHLVSGLNCGSRNCSPPVHKTVTVGLKRMRDICQPSQPPLVGRGATAVVENSERSGFDDEPLIFENCLDDISTPESSHGSNHVNILSDEELEETKKTCFVEVTVNSGDRVDNGTGETTSAFDKSSSDIIGSSQSSNDGIYKSGLGNGDDMQTGSFLVMTNTKAEANSQEAGDDMPADDRDAMLSDCDTVPNSQVTVDDMLASFVP